MGTPRPERPASRTTRTDGTDRTERTDRREPTKSTVRNLRTVRTVPSGESGAPPKASRTPLGGTRREDPARALQRLHARRLRACASLDIPVPPEAREGTPDTLMRRIAMLDRRIEVSLDLAGGRRFAPWDPEPDEETPDEDPIPGLPS